MARQKRAAVIEAIYSQKILPIFYHADVEVSKFVAKSCSDGGATLLEFTNRGDGAIDVFSALEKYCASSLQQMILGAGSIVDAATAAQYINAGASFIVGPGFSPEVAKVCNQRKVAYIPGCASTSEIMSAHETGVEFVKLFPAQEIGGPAFIKAIKGPMPWVSIVATGGVEINESLKAWFDAGVSAVGLGSSLFPSAALEKRDAAPIVSQVKKALQFSGGKNSA